MVIDIELTLNRWGFGRIAPNKIQLLCFRFAKWQIPGKHSVSFEINWLDKAKKKEKEEQERNLRRVLGPDGRYRIDNPSEEYVRFMFGIDEEEEKKD